MNSTEQIGILPEHEKLVEEVDLATALEWERRWRQAIPSNDLSLLQVCALRLAIEIGKVREAANIPGF